MEDRELLELAAKAAGQDFTWRYRKIQIGLADTWGVRQYREELQPFLNSGVFWSPLTDDGAALRLAVYLGILLRTDFIRLLGQLMGGGMEHGDATRLAIVRVAAEIGRNKP